MVADFGDFPTLEASNSTRCLVGENSAGHLLGEIGAGFPLGENVLPTPSSLGETAAQLAVEQNVARPGFAENVVGCPAAPCLGENALPGPALLDQSVPVVPARPGEQAATCRNAAQPVCDTTAVCPVSPFCEQQGTQRHREEAKIHNAVAGGPVLNSSFCRRYSLYPSILAAK